MPSLIGTLGPDGTVNTGIAANYRREQVPYSRFGSRKVVWFNIGLLSNRLGDGSVDNVKLNTLIDAIQTRAEVAIIGAPRLGQSYGRITIGVFEDTFNNGEYTSGQTAEGEVGFNMKSTTLQDAIKAALGDSTISVQEVYMYGGLSSNPSESGDYGWTSDNDYREYTFKAEYVANSYLNPNDL
jgi:hypothetical protein